MGSISRQKLHQALRVLGLEEEIETNVHIRKKEVHISLVYNLRRSLVARGMCSECEFNEALRGV